MQLRLSPPIEQAAMQPGRAASVAGPSLCSVDAPSVAVSGARPANLMAELAGLFDAFGGGEEPPEQRDVIEPFTLYGTSLYVCVWGRVCVCVWGGGDYHVQHSPRGRRGMAPARRVGHSSAARLGCMSPTGEVE